MLINKEGKLFGKISIIDIFVVVAIVVAALGLYLRFGVGNEKVETASSTISYTMAVKSVRQGTVDALQKGGSIFNTTTKEYIGDITDVTYSDAYADITLAEGRVVSSAQPERFDALVTVQIEGSINDLGFYTSSNQSLNVGSDIVFSSKYAKTTGTVLEVKEVE